MSQIETSDALDEMRADAMSTNPNAPPYSVCLAMARAVRLADASAGIQAVPAMETKSMLENAYGCGTDPSDIYDKMISASPFFTEAEPLAPAPGM